MPKEERDKKFGQELIADKNAQAYNQKYHNCLVICYNRPDSAKEVIRSVRDSNQLYLFCDGPKTDDSEGQRLQDTFKKMFAQAQELRKTKDPKSETKIFFSHKNLGQRDGPIQAIDWFLKEAKHGCILEEDIIPSKEFLCFYGACLKNFENQHDIELISACPAGTKDVDTPKDNNHAIRKSELFLPWGWATWLDRWERWKMTDPSHLASIINTKGKRDEISNSFYNLPTRLYFKKELNKLRANPHYAWSYYVQAQIKTNKGTSIMPKTNMTTNIGFNSKATRTKEPQNTICIPKQTKRLLEILSNNKSIKEFNLTSEKEVETLKYGGMIKVLRAQLGLRTRIKALIKLIRKTLNPL